MEQTLVFLLGLAFGSAINVVVARFGSSKTFFTGRSVCDHCRVPLRAWQLVPLVGFALQRGRCVDCRGIIPWRYTVVELVGGLIGLTLYQGLTPAFVLSFGFFLILLAISLIDLTKLIIPDTLLGLAAALAAVKIVLVGPNLVSVAIGVLVGLVLPAVFVVPSRGTLMGFGDIKLGGVLGAWLGFPLIGLAFWLSFVTGGVLSLLLVLSHRKRLKDRIALGPFLALGALIAYRFGSQIISYVIP